MISFYPGPSRLYPQVKAYLKDAYDEGVMSINHRSEEFMAISRKTVALLKEKLNIPEDYSVCFVSSATECWEIIAQSLVREKSMHVYNGAFGKKWFDYSSRIKPGAAPYPYEAQEKLVHDYRVWDSADVICLTQNETSNGTEISNRLMHAIRRRYSGLIAVDATSSMGGVYLDFHTADVWFASVQKCFGLPAGLALMIYSPAALEQAREINDRSRYNSLLFLDEMMQRWQTPCTPNVLNIYLLMRVMEQRKSIIKVDAATRNRYRKWDAFFESGEQLKHFIKNPSVRSKTVLTIEGSTDHIRSVKQQAREAGFLLGEGYGELNESTLRIANFPALRQNEIARLMDFLSRHR
ncbi:MAG: aminotransferase class V-fold PLP-dependent enzyme [Cyclobacteriaceae bacterium]|nr:aminotransferase class V-fold PLP-dependent enzyme [Cyclobacteriaceae bacterium]